MRNSSSLQFLLAQKGALWASGTSHEAMPLPLSLSFSNFHYLSLPLSCSLYLSNLISFVGFANVQKGEGRIF